MPDRLHQLLHFLQQAETTGAGSGAEFVEELTRLMKHVSAADPDPELMSAGFTWLGFTIPRLDTLPLHDHPGMTGLLRVLTGRLVVRSFDWVRQTEDGGIARLTDRREITPDDDVLVLYPDAGNLHEVVAAEESAFLDVFFPYYSSDRPCTYYSLEEIESDDGQVFRLTAQRL